MMPQTVPRPDKRRGRAYRCEERQPRLKPPHLGCDFKLQASLNVGFQLGGTLVARQRLGGGDPVEARHEPRGRASGWGAVRALLKAPDMPGETPRNGIAFQTRWSSTPRGQNQCGHNCLNDEIGVRGKRYEREMSGSCRFRVHNTYPSCTNKRIVAPRIGKPPDGKHFRLGLPFRKRGAAAPPLETGRAQAEGAQLVELQLKAHHE